MTGIYLVRHCEAYGNIYRRLDGIRDTDVTKLGEEQIRKVSDRFSNMQIDRVYSSALIRAVKTARGIASATDAPLEIVEMLHERKMGIFEGKTWHEVKKTYPEIFNEWQKNFKGYVIPGGESLVGAGLRFEKELLDICHNNDDNVIIVVAHSMVIKAFLDKLMGDEKQFGNNTSVSYLEYSDGRIHVIYTYDDSHLPESMRKERERWAKKGMKLEEYSLRYEYFLSEKADPEKNTIVAYETDNRVGCLNFHITDKTIFIDDLFVLEQYRRRGYATQLIGEAMYHGFRSKCTIIQCSHIFEEESFKSLVYKNNFLTTNGIIYKIIEK